MSKYYCDTCEYYTNYKGNYERHLQTNRHIKKYQSSIILVSSSINLVSSKYHKSIIDNPPHDTTTIQNKLPLGYKCEYCDRVYKYPNNMYRHKKYSCSKAKEHQEQSELTKMLCGTIVDMKKEIHKLSQQIVPLTNTVTTNSNNNITNNMNASNNNSNNSTNNIMNNGNMFHQTIHINDYNKPDLSHLTEKHYKTAINQNNHCVPEIAKMIYFNDSKPENMSIYIPSLKEKYMYVMNDGNWTTKLIKDFIPNFYEHNFYIMRQWVEDNESKINPQLMKQFRRFEHMVDDDEEVREYVLGIMKTMMFDLREKIQSNKKRIQKGTIKQL